MIATAVAWLMRVAVLFIAAMVLFGSITWVGTHPGKASGAVEGVWDKGTDIVGGWWDFFADLAD